MNTQRIFQKESHTLNVVNSLQPIFSTYENENGSFFVNQNKHYKFNMLVFLEELSPEIDIFFSLENKQLCQDVAYLVLSAFDSDSTNLEITNSVTSKSFDEVLIMQSLGNNGKGFFKIEGSFKAIENSICKPLISISTNSEFDKVCKGSYFEVYEIV